MKLKDTHLYKLGGLLYRSVSQLVWISPLNMMRLCTFFIPDLIRYRKLAKKNNTFVPNLLDSYPILGERTELTGVDGHYFHQSVWASNLIYKSKVQKHFDIGSHTSFVAGLTPFTHVTFVDIRPIDTEVPNLSNRKGNILSLPFANNSIQSLSCLHVAEHIGLGRYGDAIDPDGTRKAAKELSRVLAVGGTLYFSSPIGKERIFFNAHRVLSPMQVLDFFSELKIVQVNSISAKCEYVENTSLENISQWTYGCGLFQFTKVANSCTKKIA